jgi:hypothetical protein
MAVWEEGRPEGLPRVEELRGLQAGPIASVEWGERTPRANAGVMSAGLRSASTMRRTIHVIARTAAGR